MSFLCCANELLSEDKPEFYDQKTKIAFNPTNQEQMSPQYLFPPSWFLTFYFLPK